MRIVFLLVGLLFGFFGCSGKSDPADKEFGLDAAINVARRVVRAEPLKGDQTREIPTPHGTVTVVRQGNVVHYRRGQHFFQEVLP